MTKTLCVLFIVLVVEFGFTASVPIREDRYPIPDHLIEYATPLEILTEEFPELYTTIDILGSLVFETDFGSNLLILVERFFGPDADIFPILEIVDFVLESFLDRDTAAAARELLATVLHNPQELRDFVMKNKDAAADFTRDLAEDVTSERSEVRQRVVKDILLALMRALTTRVGQNFIEAATKNVISGLLDMDGYIGAMGRHPPYPMSEPARRIMDMMVARGGHPGDVADILHFIEDHPLLNVLLPRDH